MSKLAAPLILFLMLLGLKAKAQDHTAMVIVLLPVQGCIGFGENAHVGILLPPGGALKEIKLELSDEGTPGWEKPSLQHFYSDRQTFQVGADKFEGYLVSNLDNHFKRYARVTAKWTGPGDSSVGLFSVENLKKPLCGKRWRWGGVVNVDGKPTDQFLSVAEAEAVNWTAALPFLQVGPSDQTIRGIVTHGAVAEHEHSTKLRYVRVELKPAVK